MAFYREDDDLLGDKWRLWSCVYQLYFQMINVFKKGWLLNELSAFQKDWSTYGRWLTTAYNPKVQGDPTTLAPKGKWTHTYTPTHYIYLIVKILKIFSIQNANINEKHEYNDHIFI